MIDFMKLCDFRDRRHVGDLECIMQLASCKKQSLIVDLLFHVVTEYVRLADACCPSHRFKRAV